MTKTIFTDVLNKGFAVAVIGLRTIWCAYTSFISPVLLSCMYLCFSGKIYQIDEMFDEGTAGIIGIMLLAGWIIAAFVPDILYIMKMKSYGRKFMCIALGIAVIPALIFCIIYGGNIISIVAEGGNITSYRYETTTGYF
ncbi:MAG: hypothetical protein K2K21_03895 [Lachnospiraceae bacterium]|nr:hypothetical protein [Lachnospiraceae bacterium]